MEQTKNDITLYLNKQTIYSITNDLLNTIENKLCNNHGIPTKRIAMTVDNTIPYRPSIRTKRIFNPKFVSAAIKGRNLSACQIPDASL